MEQNNIGTNNVSIHTRVEPSRKKIEVANSPKEYLYEGKDIAGNEVNGRTDLMGEGKNLRPFYFNKWKDNLNAKHLSSCESKNGCKYIIEK